jgi:calcineurin-like phosphoesterase family protein
MTTWFTSDWHLGHSNIIRYFDRPFRDAEHMNEELIARHNAVVGPYDTVFDVGDFSLNERMVRETLPRLHGHRILVCGNHDKCFRVHHRAAYWTAKYLEWGFAEVHQQCSLLIEGQSVLVDHFPYVGDSRHEVRYMEMRPVDDGRWLIHGHVHQLWQQRGRMLNVGCDVWDYRPVHLDVIADRIRMGVR